jgi:preprotein translocase subunit YajC
MTAPLPMLPASLVALAAPPSAGSSPLVTFIPFVLVLAIFYFIILLPMKKRQKKVDEFLGGLKIGDRVVTSGGLYGTIAKMDAQTVHLQVAPNVRVEVARSAIAGYQGQAPVASEGT